MSQVFISYARSTEAIAKAVGDRLREAGYKVWRDDELPAHRSYSDVIEERLREAKAVVVLWSAEAIRSQWVRAEADVAREAGTLVQMSVDGVTPPIPFNQIQCADVNGWSGDTNHPGWGKVADSVASLVGAQQNVDEAPREASAPSGLTICVLPFVNMSGDGDQEYFSDGITEDVITDLSKVSALEVVARNTAFAYKGQVVDIKKVARELGLSHVIEGSVRKAGGRVRITAQLIDGGNGKHLWADRYDRELDDIFAIQDEISKAIVAALKVTLLPKEKKAIEHRGTTNSDAYNLYLMARQNWINANGLDQRPVEIAERICGQAVAIDPEYARAWGLMALARARLRVTYDKDYDVEQAAEKALTIDPENVEALCARAMMLGARGQHAEAWPFLNRALENDPESFEVHKEVARAAFQEGNIDKAIEHFEKTMRLLSTDYHGAGMLMTCYKAKKDPDNAKRVAQIVVDRCEKIFAKDPVNGPAFGMGVGALSVMGDLDRAQEWLDRALLVDPDNLHMRYNLACTLACEMEDKDKAIEVLEPFFAKIGYEMLHHSEADPDMDPIRDDPRYQEMYKAALKRTDASRAAS
ncbi:TIR domain-containing protein [Sphingomicrobium sediminis]|uniref:TIR domain-containing protein n=1 Tax=Sphingomicrobium sediminis TaxID=2950949 RepID=A0A9X2EFY0_9SPHN|nr:TIR domain-containing protein [Sphingomicrobium sediminis]MCM8556671.1 TIR domain-containing protein [Sphingomicrobium sediminis]